MSEFSYFMLHPFLTWTLQLCFQEFTLKNTANRMGRTKADEHHAQHQALAKHFQRWETSSL